jgi:ribosome-binding factor A
MEESKRQRQVAKLIQEEMNTIFQKEGLTMMQGGMVSISKVQVTPDLLEARIYLSFFKVANIDNCLQIFKEKSGELRGQLGNKLRHQLRRIPEIQFFNDDTLDYVFKMEALFKQLKSDENNPS